MPLLPQFGFFELLTVAVIALVVVGPRDLPAMMRSMGRMAAQARKLAGEFTAAFDQMAREAEMEDMRKEIEALKKDNVFSETRKTFEDAVAPVSSALRNEAGEVRDALNKPAHGTPSHDDDDDSWASAIGNDISDKSAAGKDLGSHKERGPESENVPEQAAAGDARAPSDRVSPPEAGIDAPLADPPPADADPQTGKRSG